MTRKNIKIPKSLFRALKDDKGKHMSWPTYLEQQCLETDRADLEDVRSAAIAAEANTEEIKRQIEELQVKQYG